MKSNGHATPRRLAGRALLASAVAAAAALAMLAVTATASAETLPDAPRPPESCTASLTLTPSVIVFTRDEPVALQVSGLEPHAEYRVFAGDRVVAGGFVAGDGTATPSIVVNTLVAASVPVQVVTAGRCAAATLTVAGPLRIICDPVIVSGGLILCPLRLR